MKDCNTLTAVKDINISVCGTDCSTCDCFGKMCNGCNSCDGKVFHAPEGKACAIYECVKKERNLHNCGQCGQVPCRIWLNTRDPKFSDEEFEKNVNSRIQTLKEGTKGLTENTQLH